MITRARALFVIPLALAIAGLVVLYAACGGGKAPCAPSNCTGCCDTGGTCQTGNVQTACGLGGAACQSCPTGHSCQVGTCSLGSGGGGDSGTNTDGGAGADGGTGSDGGTNVDGGASDAGTQDGGQTGNDGGSDGGVGCTNNAQCGGGKVCCSDVKTGSLSCQSSCPPGDGWSCSGPTDCNGSGRTCCLVAVLDGGSPPLSCSFASSGTTCQTSCPNNLPQELFSCAGFDELVICQQTPDCQTDAGYKCCSLTSSGQSAHVCLDPSIQAFVTCM